MTEERANQPQQDDEGKLQKIAGISQRAFETADLINRTEKASSGLLQIANRFSLASRKTLGAITGGSLCLIVWSTYAPAPFLQRVLLAPIAGAFGGAISALVIPASLEERRRRELDELETRILRLEGTYPELKEPLMERYKILASASSTELNPLLLPPSQPLQQNVLPSPNLREE